MQKNKLLLFYTTSYLACLCLSPTMVMAEQASVSIPDLHTRTLAASCSACHGFNGNSVAGTPVLAGLNADHFIKQMMDFRSGVRPSTVMHRHAKGLNEEEIRQLAVFFAAQPRVNASSLKSQSLQTQHSGGEQ